MVWNTPRYHRWVRREWPADRELRPAGEGLWESYCGVWNLVISNWESQYF